MHDIQALPDIFTLIINHVVLAVGISKAVLLRTISQSFNAAILEAILISKIVDIDDPATPDLVYFMGTTLRGKILLAKSRSAEANSKTRLSVLKTVNSTLDTLIGETDEVQVSYRHQSIAEAVGLMYSVPYWGDEPVNAKLEAQNLLSGSIVVGNLSLVKYLLESPSTLAEINGITPYFGRPLIIAAAWGRLDVVRYLLNCGARPDLYFLPGEPSKRESADWTPQRVESSWRLWGLSSYCDPPASALRAAMLGGYKDIVELLLLQKHKLSSTSFEYLRAVQAGVIAGRLDLIKTMFQIIGKSLSDFPGLGNEMLWEAIRCDRKDLLQHLLDNGVDIHAFPYPDIRRSNRGTLSIAARYGNTSMIRFLIERGADVNFDGPSRDGSLPIEVAAECGQEEVVELFLELGADSTKALQSAAKHSQNRVVDLLLKIFPDLTSREEGDVGRSALLNAICSRNLTTITLLVEAGVSLNEGYEYASGLPINCAKQGAGQWVINHLVALGAQETETIAYDEKPVTIRGVVISECTWEWASHY